MISTPGTTYFYQFEIAGSASSIGRTRTLPTAATSLTIAVASCSNYAFGYFNAYDAIAQDDEIDVVLHLGDYIYEYGADEWGGGGGATYGRVHRPDHEIVSLDDYRQRHAQYKSDTGSQAMLAAHPLIATWDDHESTNNPWRGGAQNHQPQTEGDWPQRLDASLQAYFEWMPVRDPDGEARALWRRFDFGNLVNLTTLETRHTGRSRQIKYADHLADIDSPSAAERFEHEVLGADDRSMLSPAMRDFLAHSIDASVPNAWQVVGNQIPLARIGVPDLTGLDLRSSRNDPVGAELDRLATLSRFNLPFYLDTWDGYGAARRALLAQLEGQKPAIVLTGDSHAFWANELILDARPIGYEIGTAGITSPGDFQRFGDANARELDRRVVRDNAAVLWTENRFRGFVKVSFTPMTCRANYVAVSDVSQRHYRTFPLKQWTIDRGGTSRFS